MENSTSSQSRGCPDEPENDDEPSTRDAISRKELEKIAEVPLKKPVLSLADDLPAEIRLNIYRHLFNVPDKFFELQIIPEIPGYRAVNSYSVLAAQTGGLRMMRVCKKIRGEVAEHFYGGNSFRFSQPNSVVLVSGFFHTIGNFNCSFFKHITFQMPSAWVNASPIPLLGGPTHAEWDKICGDVSRRGMGNPDYENQPKYNRDPWSWPEYCYDEAVQGVFSRLRDMPNLKKLEVTIPAKYKFFTFDKVYSRRDCTGQQSLHCRCLGEHIQAMIPDDRIRHIFRDHSVFGKYWDLLADLKETAASEDLKIALVFLYSEIHYPRHRAWRLLVNLQHTWNSNFRHRQGFWTAAYATIMGYELGHARWERDDKRYMTYKVRYDEEPMPSKDPSA